MKVTESAKANSFPTRERIREATETLREASEKLEEIRDHFNLEMGENKCCDLDLAVRYALRRIGEAQTELHGLLSRRRLGLNFRDGRSYV